MPLPADDLSDWDPFAGQQTIGGIGKAGYGLGKAGPATGPAMGTGIRQKPDPIRDSLAPAGGVQITYDPEITDPSAPPTNGGNGENHTLWYVGGGLAVVAVLGVGVAIAASKPKRRRRRRRRR